MPLFQGAHFPVFYIVLFLILGFFLIRPWFMGIKIRNGKIVIVSWFWVYRIPISDIEEVMWLHYSGLINGWVEGSSWDPFVIWVRMLAIARYDRVERGYASTIGSRKRLRAIVYALREVASLPETELDDEPPVTRENRWFWQREPFASLFRRDKYYYDEEGELRLSDDKRHS